MCLSNCPKYKLVKEETATLRGLIQLINNQIDSKFYSSFIKDCAQHCNNEFACEINCPTGVNYTEICQILKKI